MLPALLSAVPRPPGELQEHVPDSLTPGFATGEVWSHAITVLDLMGVFAFAVSGAVLAVRKGYDIVGSIVLGALVGLGGGMMRDVILERDPPAAFGNILYLAMPALATALVYLGTLENQRSRRTIQVFDAVGLAVFCVIGTRIALIGGYGLLPAALLGTMTAVGGGLLRDVVAGDPPAIFGREGMYAVPAFLGGLATAVLGSVGGLNVVTAVMVMAVVLALRLVALRRNWQVASALRGGRLRPAGAGPGTGERPAAGAHDGDGPPPEDDRTVGDTRRDAQRGDTDETRRDDAGTT